MSLSSLFIALFAFSTKALEIFAHLWYHYKCQEEIYVILGVILL